MEKHAISSYRELVKRSIDEPEWFWDAVAKDLGVDWFQPYHNVLDASAGAPWAKWFVGGKINVAYNCVDRHAKGERRDKAAYIWEDEDGQVRKLTYLDLYRETNKVANSLKELGVKKGDTAGILMPMLPEAIEACFACIKIGAIFVPIFSGYGPQAIASRLQDSEAKILITCDGFLRRGPIELKTVADKAVESSPSVKHIIVYDRLSLKVPWKDGRDLKWSDLVAKSSSECEPEVTDASDPFLLAYTSGTTGKPKGAVHVHGGFSVKVAQEVAYQFDFKDQDVLCWVTEMGWIMGPWEVIGAGILGGTVFIFEGAPDHPSPDRLWSMVEKHRITTLGISPTLIRMLMKYGEDYAKKHDLSSLRILGSTGEPWNPDPWMWFFRNIGGGRCPIINISGGTEIGACFLSPLPITPLKSCTLVGPSLGMDVDVFDEKGNPIRGSVGELVAKKPWPGMTAGIWRDPKRFIDTYWSRWPNIWVHGDWASIDEDGYWFLHGRSDDTIKVAGRRLGPAEIESAMVSHPAVLEVAAVGVPDEIKGENLVCLAVLKPGFKPQLELKEELKRHIESQLGKTLRPDDIRFVRFLPKTSSAKIMRRLIKAKLMGKQQIGDTSTLENSDALDEIDLAV
ncbi:MAG: acetate--CoA ligase [Thaumarchaeota archaeon]|nr:acetate--CoA ligase [Nitrososphaerota archaeon]